jgi:hypothetical protein
MEKFWCPWTESGKAASSIGLGIGPILSTSEDMKDFLAQVWTMFAVQ